MNNTLQKELDNLKLDSSNDEDNEIVIRGFMDRYDVTYEEASEIFEETKKFLELSVDVRENENAGVFIDHPLLIIDEMWHTFILHTRQYMKFCLGRFNRFIHHIPTPSSHKEVIQERFNANPTAVIKENEERLKLQYSRIYDKFGAETLIKWYDTLPQKYTPEYIKSIKRA